MRRAGVVTVLLAMTAVVVGCASTGHTWQDEFTARLEGAARTVEEAREDVHPHMTPDEYGTVFWPLGETLFFKSELIAKLHPPKGCEALQVKGKAAVFLAGSLLGGLFENLTPGAERGLPRDLEGRLALFERREREAKTCATG
jgi:hypothetical protein